jgi:hypothetical protein
MIRIEKIEIHEFRGIRGLTLGLKGQNFAVCGPNGTGKSGIVDAIEFALTGGISRLSGSGTGGLSVKLHGPHVDSRNKPDDSWVTLDVVIPSLDGKNATIHRTVKGAGSPTITPNDPKVLAAFDGVKLHPEFVLSRRELIRYVLSEPGQRNKEVQALLRLEDIEKLRTVLQKIDNACTRELSPLDRAEKDAVTGLMSALGVAELTRASVLEAANAMREVLGLSPLTALEATTSLKDGLATAAAGSVSSRVPKVQPSADVAALKDVLGKLRSEAFEKACGEAAEAAAELGKDADSLHEVSREALLRSALDLFDDKVCPVCDTPFLPEEFREHVAAKLEQLDAVAAKRAALEAQIGPLLDVLHAAGTALATVITHGRNLTPPVDVKALADFETVRAERYRQLQTILPLDDTRAVLLNAHRAPDLTAAIATLETRVAAIPEPTKQDAARDFLVVAQERFEQYRKSKLKAAAGELRAKRAEKVFAVFSEVTTNALEGIYKAVEKAFSEYYREINKDDESAFTAMLMPSIGKLGFDVDFYGRGHFPPGAYHSEGHQDSMGLCLYLALMNHLLGENFTFAVLDDVLMSVDAGHRQEVCTLLKRKFSNVQFIFTTHDEIWLKHMKSEGVIEARNFAHFRTWSVDLGPTKWDDRDIWAELDEHLALNDVRAAAALLRHVLEHFAKEACDRLRAPVEFRGDAQFMLGDLLPNATNTLGDLFKKAKAAANSWGLKEVTEKISAREVAFTEAKSKAGLDQWQLNAATHFNAWANFQKQDFAPLVTAYKNLTRAFACEKCQEMFRVAPERGKKESLRCGCGELNLNLLPKAS